MKERVFNLSKALVLILAGIVLAIFTFAKAGAADVDVSVPSYMGDVEKFYVIDLDEEPVGEYYVDVLDETGTTKGSACFAFVTSKDVELGVNIFATDSVIYTNTIMVKENSEVYYDFLQFGPEYPVFYKVELGENSTGYIDLNYNVIGETEPEDPGYLTNPSVSLTKSTFDLSVDNYNDVLAATSVEFYSADGTKYEYSGFRDDVNYSSVDGVALGDGYYGNFTFSMQVRNADGSYVTSHFPNSQYMYSINALEPGDYMMALVIDEYICASCDFTISDKFVEKVTTTVKEGSTDGFAPGVEAYVAKFVPEETALYQIWPDTHGISGQYVVGGVATLDENGSLTECLGALTYYLEKGKAYYIVARPNYCESVKFELIVEKAKEIKKIDLKMKQTTFDVGHSYNVFMYENEELFNISYDITITYTDGTVEKDIVMSEELIDPYGNYLIAKIRRTDDVQWDYILAPGEYEIYFEDVFGNEYHNNNRMTIETPKKKISADGPTSELVANISDIKNANKVTFIPEVSGYYVIRLDALLDKKVSYYGSISAGVTVVGEGYYNHLSLEYISDEYTGIYLEAGKEYYIWSEFNEIYGSDGEWLALEDEAYQFNIYLTCDLNEKSEVKSNVLPSILYRTHVQSFGWQNFVFDGDMSGTSGLAKRLEGIEIKLDSDYDLGIQYTTHVQSYGWLDWSANGEMSGTEGEAKRLEAIKIQLTGADKDKFDVYYRVHAQSYGWLGWAKNGQASGTAGYAKRLEAIQIVIVPKGEKVPNTYEGITSATTKAYVSADGKTNVTVAGADKVHVIYQPMVEGQGWKKPVKDQASAGTTGSAKRLEALKVSLGNQLYEGGITYRSHVQTYGWENEWKYDGEISGNTTQGKRLEAIQIELYGEMAEKYDVYYRTHVQKFGWLGWAKNGQDSGSAGYAYRIEAIEIVLVPKGGKAPGSTVNCFKQK